MAHEQAHEQARETVILHPKADSAPDGIVEGAKYDVEDYWDRIGGGSWMFAEGNPAAIKFAIRSGFANGEIPLDDEVVYGKINGRGHIIHVSELGEVVPA